MQKTSLICSLLTGFALSMAGCEPPKPAVKPAAKSAGAGSTTGGGADVPATPPSGGAAEAPKSDAKPTEDKPAVEAPKGDEAPKTDEAPKN